MHLRAKYRQLEDRARAARVPGPRAEPAPHHRHEPRVDGEYIVAVREVANPRDVAARAGVTGVRFMMNFFGGRLSDEQLAALRADPDVDYVEDNAIGRLR
ncbi:hypothetical protein Vau01_087410 [Virgisporangium aurantiacum]|uniref:Uncharacterized protein n=1 Tax=Virgisporangium aurantiacum TaxID=175570 RepID=A0A8J4E3T5_9ACTN|nr:hypothetical protein Vau01_087410 [Virgisporangium aurantiacum]